MVFGGKRAMITASNEAKQELTRLAATARKSQRSKHPASDERLGARVGMALAKTRMGKYVSWQMQPGGILDWHFHDDKIAADQARLVRMLPPPRSPRKPRQTQE